MKNIPKASCIPVAAVTITMGLGAGNNTDYLLPLGSEGRASDVCLVWANSRCGLEAPGRSHSLTFSQPASLASWLLPPSSTLLRQVESFSCSRGLVRTPGLQWASASPDNSPWSVDWHLCGLLQALG